MEEPFYDVVVVGAGSGGIGAAIAATRNGLRTLLIDSHHILGGTSTVGGVNCWEPGVGGTGIPFDIYKRLKRIPNGVGIYSAGRHFCRQGEFYWPHTLAKVNFPGGENLVDSSKCYLDTLQRFIDDENSSTPEIQIKQWHGVLFEPAALNTVVREMLDETMLCDLRLGTSCVSATAYNGSVQSINLTDGTAIRAQTWIDASGDAELCRLCGCEQLCGIESQARFKEPDAPEEACETVNGTTLCYRISPVNGDGIEPLPDNVPATSWWTSQPVAACINQYPNGDRNVNMLPTMDGMECLRLGRDAAYAECKRRVLYHWHFIQTNFPEFRHYRLTWIAPMLGVRESHRTVCEAMLTQNDILLGLRGQRAKDIITIADHALDRHGRGGCAMELRQPYGIPFRCLIPRGYSNLLVACRGAGFSAIAATSCRLSRTMMQLGQAAGTAAALAKQAGVNIPAVKAESLRNALRKQHVQLAWPCGNELRDYLAAENILNSRAGSTQ